MAKAPATLPLHIRTNIGASPKTLFSVLLVLLVVEGLPLLAQVASGASLQEVLFSGNALATAGTMATVAIIVVLTRRVATLDIDQDGVTVASRKSRYFYAWPDIAHVVRVNKAVRLELRGRTDDQNQYNEITERFGVPLDELAGLLREGVERWGAPATDRPGAVRTRAGIAASVTPGDIPGKATADIFRTMATLMGALFLLIFGSLVGWQGLEYNKAVHLQHNGVRTEAAVTRIMTDDCTRSGCAQTVDYTFQAGAGSPLAGKTVQGHAYLAGDNYRDNPDYLYATSKHTVPIAYDKTNPARSDLNFDDSIFRIHPLDTLLFMIGVLGGITAVVFGGFMTMLYFSLRKARLKAQTAVPLAGMA